MYGEKIDLCGKIRSTRKLFIRLIFWNSFQRGKLNLHLIFIVCPDWVLYCATRHRPFFNCLTVERAVKSSGLQYPKASALQQYPSQNSQNPVLKFEFVKFRSLNLWCGSSFLISWDAWSFAPRDVKNIDYVLNFLNQWKCETIQIIGRKWINSLLEATKRRFPRKIYWDPHFWRPLENGKRPFGTRKTVILRKLRVAYWESYTSVT